jgi:hypothetical protein
LNPPLKADILRCGSNVCFTLAPAPEPVAEPEAPAQQPANVVPLRPENADPPRKV